MRTEPDLDPRRVTDVLLDRYQLDVTELAFVPYGIDSWSYVASCRDGARVFVKLSRPVGGGRWPPSEGPLLAALAAHGVPVPRPIADRDGGFQNEVDGFDVQVFEYLDGRNLEDQTAWPDSLYTRVAAIVATVHESTSAVRHLVERVERYALPFVPPFLETLARVEAGRALPADDDPAAAALRVVVRPRVRELRTAISRLGVLRDVASARAGHADLVLCHTDIWGSNLLLSEDETLQLLDWNGALLGPPEADLFMFAGTDFFPAERFGWFLERYEAAYRQVPLHADTFGFYFYRRTLEDLAWFVDAIAAGRREAMDPDALLRIVAENLAEVPRLEGRIRDLARVLAEAHPTSAG